MSLNFLDKIPQLPVEQWVSDLTDWITDTFEFFFEPVKEHLGDFIEWMSETLQLINPIIFILLIATLAFVATGKRFGLAAFGIIGLVFIYNQGLWSHLMEFLQSLLKLLTHLVPQGFRNYIKYNCQWLRKRSWQV